jgi:carboxyl-terminal processing protease
MLKVDDATHEVVVGTPLPGSPALRGGLRAGDRVLEIEGNGLPRGKELETAVKLLRGAPGSAVSLAVKRAGSDRLLGIELVRDTVRLQSVKGDRYKEDATWEFMLDEQRKIGYVRLTQVGNQSAKEMEAALLELKERGIKALILDLRNNPGGTLDGAVAVADLFVENGTIVTVKGRTGEQRYEAEPEGTFSGFAMALLVNRNTASAAEIIAACLQDHQRALVVGERTFGQAIVRSLFTLRGGAGALKLPVAAYYRPSGKTMNRYPDSKDSEDWGVQPRAEDEVRFTDDELRQYEKYRAERDILNNPEPLKLRFEDAQLRRALEAVLQPRRSD